MTGTVYLLWFEPEQPEGMDDIELLIGVYASESDASAAIEGVKRQSGFKDYAQGFHIYSHEVGRDGWTEGFIRD